MRNVNQRDARTKCEIDFIINVFQSIDIRVNKATLIDVLLDLYC